MKRGRSARVGAVQFSAEPFNLSKTSSFKASGACVRAVAVGHDSRRLGEGGEGIWVFFFFFKF